MGFSFLRVPDIARRAQRANITSQTGLFSASVAVLLAVSIGDLRPSSQDTSAFYLQNIYQLLSDPNRSDPTIPSTPSIPPAFSPPNYAVWVNSLWFLSLSISLTCGFQATLLQQWARRYIKITQSPDHNAQKRARIRAFFSEGVKTLHVPWVVETLPTLLHLSLFLFFAGLVIYLFNINHTVFTVVAWWVGLCTTTYVGVTLMPLFRYDSPYYAPLSSSAWYLVNGVVSTILMPLESLWRRWFRREDWDLSSLFKLMYKSHLPFHLGITSVAEGTAEGRSPEAYYSAVKRVLEFSDDDLYLEEIFALIPGFFKSKAGEDAQELFKDGLVSSSLLKWMNRTLSSHTLSGAVKQRRVALCRQVMEITSLPVTYSPLDLALLYWDKFFGCIDSALILKAATYDDPEVFYNSQCAISRILASVEIRDNIWCELATSHMGISESVLQDYLKYGDTVLLANLNSFIRRAIDYYPSNKGFPNHMAHTLKALSKLDVQDTLPELQHDFCTLWNDLVQMSRSHSTFRGPNEILTGIRDIYVALHPSTASTLPAAFSVPVPYEDGFRFSLELPSPYPLCTVADHTGSASHIVAGTAELQARTSPTMFGGGKSLDSGTPTDVDALSSPTPSPYHADLSPANKHSLDDIPAAPRRRSTSIIAPSAPAAHFSPVYDEDRPSPANPFDSSTTFVIRNTIYTDTIEHSANSHSRTSLQTTSTPTLPLSSISHSNLTDPSQQDEESTVVPPSTFSYPPSSSIPLFTNNTPPASAFSSLPASAGDHIPAILVFLSPSTSTATFLFIPL